MAEPGGAWFNYVPGTTYYLPDGTPISGADLLNNPALNRSPGGNPYVANLQNLPVPASSLNPGGAPWTPVGGGGNLQPVDGTPINPWADPNGGTWGDAAHLPAFRQPDLTPLDLSQLGPNDLGGVNTLDAGFGGTVWGEPGTGINGGGGGVGMPDFSGYNPGDIRVPGVGNSILSGNDLSTILSGIPGLGGGGIPGIGKSALNGSGGIGNVLGGIFGGKGNVPNLNSILRSVLPIASTFLQYLGSEGAFNKAGNLISGAEQGAASGVRGATGTANDLLNSLMSSTTANAAPYIGAGAGAAGQLSSDLQPGGALNSTLTADQLLKNDPGYQFRLGQGEGDLQSRLAAEGLTGSGEAQKQLSDYQQNFASNEFQNAFQRQQQQQQNLFSRLAGTAGLGLQGGGQALSAADLFGAPQASNTIASSVYGGNAGVAGAGAQAGAALGINQQKNAMIQNILTSLLGLLRPASVNSGQQPNII